MTLGDVRRRRVKGLDLWRNDIREHEAACLIAELIGEARVILNVGPSWGRDFYALTERRKQVVNMDLAPQRYLPAMVQGDASRGFPFPAHFFDAAVMAEVLEHLIRGLDCPRRGPPGPQGRWSAHCYRSLSTTTGHLTTSVSILPGPSSAC